MTDGHQLTGAWTPRRQAMAYQQVLDAITRARRTVVEFTKAGQHARDKALRASADGLLEHAGEVLEANKADLADARQAGMSPGGLDWLRLTRARVAELAEQLRHVAELPSPVSEQIPTHSQLARIPLGVVGVIYEPQPSTTMLASAPVLKAGNAVLLRGSPEATRTDAALIALLRAGLSEAGVPADAVQALSTSERSTIRHLVSAYGLVDLVVLRAGASLARRARFDATVPLVELGHGICHIYLDHSADPTLTHRVVLDSTLAHRARTGAAHTVLVHRDASPLLPALIADLTRAGITVRGDEHVAAVADQILPATEDDWREEYLELELAVRMVESLDAAVEHINEFGTGHTEVIVTDDTSAARGFAARVNAATISINTVISTATEFPELFATQRHHPRGPVHPAAFTTTKQITWPQ